MGYFYYIGSHQWFLTSCMQKAGFNSKTWKFTGPHLCGTVMPLVYSNAFYDVSPKNRWRINSKDEKTKIELFCFRTHIN